jgi:Fe2+ or Zn2+ uptake regulation protein
MNSQLFEQVDRQFREYLRSTRQKGTHHRAIILQVFLQNTRPVTSKDVLYQVKAIDRSVSSYCVRQTLQLLVKSGLAQVIIPDDGTARRYMHELAIAQCSHAHLVCKDCGVVIQ